MGNVLDRYCLSALVLLGLARNLSSGQVTAEYLGSLWSDMVDVAIRENVAFCSMRYGLQVLDVSNPESPHSLSQIYLPEQVGRIAIQGDYAYIVNGDAGLKILDISDLSRPEIVGHYQIPTYGSLAIAGDHILNVDGSYFLSIINISDPHAPYLETEFQLVMPGMDLCLEDTLAIIAEQDFLEVLNISDPAGPVRVGGRQTNVIGLEIAGDGPLICMVTQGHGIYIFYVTDQGIPYVQGNYSPAEPPTDIFVDDTLAYLTCNADYEKTDSGLIILDISDPAAPGVLSTQTTFSGAIGVTVRQGVAYINEGASGFELINISDPESPARLGDFKAIESLNHTIAGNRAYLAGSAFGIVDISNLQYLSIAGRCPLPDFYGRAVAVRDTIAYLAGHRLTGTSNCLFYIISIADDSSPYVIDSVILPNNCGYDLKISGNYLCVATLLVYDVSDPIHPELEGYYPGGLPGFVELFENYAMIPSNYYDTVGVFDISNPASPGRVGSFLAPVTFDAAIKGDFAFLAQGDWLSANGTLSSIDIRNPQSPIVIGTLDLPGRMALSIDVENNLAACGVYSYIIGYPDGLYFFDVRNPSTPELTGVFEMPGIIWGLTLDSNIAYVSSRFGFHIVKINADCCDHPGDFTNDNNLNALDITAMINNLYKGGPPAICPDEADTNGSGIFNILDITYLINYLYKGGSAPKCP